MMTTASRYQPLPPPTTGSGRWRAVSSAGEPGRRTPRPPPPGGSGPGARGGRAERRDPKGQTSGPEPEDPVAQQPLARGRRQPPWPPSSPALPCLPRPPAGADPGLRGDATGGAPTWPAGWPDDGGD